MHYHSVEGIQGMWTCEFELQLNDQLCEIIATVSCVFQEDMLEIATGDQAQRIKNHFNRAEIACVSAACSVGKNCF